MSKFSSEGFLKELTKYNDIRTAVVVAGVAGVEKRTNVQVIKCDGCEKCGITNQIVVANWDNELLLPPPAGFRIRKTPLCERHNAYKIDRHFRIKDTGKMFHNLTTREVLAEQASINEYPFWDKKYEPNYEKDFGEEEDPYFYSVMTQDQLMGQVQVLTIKQDEQLEQQKAADASVIKNWFAPQLSAQPVVSTVTCCEPIREKIKHEDEGDNLQDLYYYVSLWGFYR